MPLTLIEQPPTFCSAYKPLSIGVSSTKHPTNTTPGEYGIAITTIKVADAADVLTYGAPLEVGDLFVYHTSLPLATITVGQTVKITGSNIVDYNGVWRVLKVVSDKVKVIACDNFGTAIMGTMEKYYENYTLVAVLTNQASVTTTTYDVTTDEAGIFYMDPSDRLRVTFRDVFAIAEGGDPFALINAERYITQQYSVAFSEAYNIPDDDGVNVYTELGKTGSILLVGNLIAVNSVQPYHHIDEADGSPDLLWEDDLEFHTVFDDEDEYRWLTYHPSTPDYDPRTANRLSRTDSAWLAFLWGDSDSTGTIKLRVVWYDSAGASTATFTNLDLDKDSYIFDAGPVAQSIPSNAVRYSVAIMEGGPPGSGDPLLPDMWFELSAECVGGTRFFVFNRFGAIDSYTADGGRVSRAIDVDRRMVSKSGMGRTISVGGDYQRRTYATDPVAAYGQNTRKEGKAIARWIIDELLSSPDTRIQVYDGDQPAYTRVIFETDKADAGVRAMAFELVWTLGTDNQRQTR